jgi:alkanesulfonate monooxygenase SsuD/methylene tetrahydromethanopterin reductase-like flavin-dependent oxidoreductase (luciferase family)
MQLDIHFYGTAPMSNAGSGPPDPTERRISNQDVVACYTNLEKFAIVADELGFNTMWLTEHHFQYEGYEVTPNLILMGTYLAARTKQLRFGQMFNVVPQWHPLRLAEDYAIADIMTGGRLVFGVGRGTVPREARNLGSVVASGDNEFSAQADQINREIFEEAMEVIKLAWDQETFSYTGKHFTFPVPGIPDRGKTVTTLTLIPRPVSTPVPIYQPVSSPKTLDYVARAGHRGIFAMSPYKVIASQWELFAETAAGYGRELGPLDRVLQLPVHVAKSSQEAIDRARGPHDEYVKFLAPYGRFSKVVDGAPVGYRPSLEESRDSGTMAIGSVGQVVDILGRYRELLGVEHIVALVDLPGLEVAAVEEQLVLLAQEVLPQLEGGN